MTKSNAELNTKLQHIDIYHHWLRQEVQEGKIKIDWTPTLSMAADGLMKALPRQRHEAFIEQLNLVNIEERIKSK